MKIKKIFIWVGVMVLLVAGATIGYMLILNLPFVDALYMTVITISTVGYREVADMNTLAKWFSIGFILVSVGMVGYLLTTVFTFLSEGNINEAWRKNKMKKEIEKLNNHIIVCGAGETGLHVIKQLKRREVEFVVIENDVEAIDTLKEMNVKYILDDATKEEVLLDARVKEAKGLIACLAKDADNVFVVLTARELNTKMHIVARSHEERSDKKLRRAGANNTVSPDEIGGKKMAAMMLSPNVQFFVDNIIDTKNMSIDMEEVVVKEESELIGKKLRDAKISEKAGLIVLAIRRENDVFIFNPKADEVLRLDDKMIVVGSKDQIKALKKMSLDFDI
ncbi:MAG: potassium channel protein [Tenericutes bacterium HGW-Tenericutes-3]|nr:MAG: potassium channel protein [Tenericutes bacterium HGW-Tenericutes-3]